MTTLITCSHGTHSPEGRAAITALTDHVRALLPGVRIESAFVDVEQPEIAEVVARCVVDDDVVVVPLLLSTGYHTEHDIAHAIGAYPGRAVATRTLGPHELLVDLLVSRLIDQDFERGDPIVLAAAGSSDAAAATDVSAMAAMLSERLLSPVHVGYAAGTGPRIDEAIEAARAASAPGQAVTVASYVLAPGYFANVIAKAGGDRVTAPLAPDIRVAQIVADRYASARLTRVLGVSDTP